jgi:hypothetical protein
VDFPKHLLNGTFAMHLVLCFFVANARGQGQWNSKNLFTPRANSAACTMPGSNTQTLVFGGDTGVLDDQSFAQSGTGIVRLQVAAKPPARSGHMLSYDALRNRATLFGGQGTSGAFGDTWTFDGTNWTNRLPLTSPPPRARAVMLFHSASQGIILFGGQRSQLLFDETWSFNGTTWTQQAYSVRPPARHRATATNLQGGDLAMFGGEGSLGIRNDTWTFGLSGWTQTPGVAPPARADAVLIQSGAALLLSGGTDGSRALQDVWALQSGVWSLRPPSANLPRYAAAAAVTANGQWLLTSGRDTNGALLGDALLFSAVSWTTTAPAEAPSGRTGACAAFDAVRNEVVLFGGVDALSQLLDDTFTMRGTIWQQNASATRPSAREHAAMAYNPTRNGTVMFGGRTSLGGTNDTWQFDGTNWQSLPFSALPAARQFHALVMEPAGSLLLFGGTDNNFSVLDDTWRLTAGGWQVLAPSHKPSARQYHAMATFSRNNYVVLFGGSDGATALDDTWTFDGSDWSQATPATHPSARQYHAMTFASERNEILLFGGLDRNFLALQDTFGFNGITWNPRPSANLPGARFAAAMASDAVREETVLIGGTDSATWWPDCHTFRSPINAQYLLVGSGCSGSNGVPTLTAVDNSRPWMTDTLQLRVDGLPLQPSPLVMIFGYTFTNWNGAPLPIDLSSYGMPGCFLHEAFDETLLYIQPGRFFEIAVPVPLIPHMNGQNFANQVLVVDPTAGNPLGVTISNAFRGVIGIR